MRLSGYDNTATKSILSLRYQGAPSTLPISGTIRQIYDRSSCRASTARTLNPRCRNGRLMRQPSAEGALVCFRHHLAWTELQQEEELESLTRELNSGPMMSAGPHPQVPLTPQQIQQQQQAQAQAQELAKRRSRKPTDKNMPDGVEDSVIDGEIVQRYKALREVERKLDATMTRKRLDVVDSINRASKVRFSVSSGGAPDPFANEVTDLQDYAHMGQQHGGGSSLARQRAQRRRLRLHP